MSRQSSSDVGETALGSQVKRPAIAIVGGGPAGLRAAEVAAAAGAAVTIFDAKPSVGRKFLVAGRGGLNLTKQEPLDRFLANYQGPQLPRERWNSWITKFDPNALRTWASELGVETFAASTGRVYPREMKAAPLLRRWVQRLRNAGVKFEMQCRWCGLRPGQPLALSFETARGRIEQTADAVILAMGGGSWPQTGSDGGWVSPLEKFGIEIAPLQPANCGWEVAWPEGLLAKAEGQPLKNIVASAEDQSAIGELMITQYGLEGGAIYQLGSALRAQAEPRLTIDLKPALSIQQLVRKLGPLKRNFIAEAQSRWRLGSAAFAVLEGYATPSESGLVLAQTAKALVIPLLRPRPIAEAISSAGGVGWGELDDTLMLKKIPGVFCAGEMIDWEAPTGGYLMQACFATGTCAGDEAFRFAELT